MNGITLDLVRQTYRGGFRNRFVTHKRALYFSCTEPVPADFDNVVDAPDDPYVTVLVYAGGVAGLVPALLFVILPVNLFITLIVAVNSSSHAGPGCFEDELPLFSYGYIIAFIINDGNFIAEERLCSGAGL